jgi:hypothetical protein
MHETVYRTDPKRIGRHQATTNIKVRAKGPQGFDRFDIAELSRESLIAWLRSRGGKNEWAESVVLMLLGHAPIHLESEFDHDNGNGGK